MDVDEDLIHDMLQLVEMETGLGKGTLSLGIEGLSDWNDEKVIKHAAWLKENGMLDVNSVREGAGHLPVVIHVDGLSQKGKRELVNRRNEE